MVFPVVVYGCESWTVKKAERRRIDAFELWYWRRLLRVPWTARRSNQSIPKEISPGCSLEGMMLKLKLQYFGHLLQRVDSLEKTLMLGGIGDRRRRGRQKMKWLDGITDSVGMSLSKLWEMLRGREAWRAAVHRVKKSQTQLGDCKTATKYDLWDPRSVCCLTFWPHLLLHYASLFHHECFRQKNLFFLSAAMPSSLSSIKYCTWLLSLLPESSSLHLDITSSRYFSSLSTLKRILQLLSLQYLIFYSDFSNFTRSDICLYLYLNHPQSTTPPPK